MLGYSLDIRNIDPLLSGVLELMYTTGEAGEGGIFYRHGTGTSTLEGSGFYFAEFILLSK